MKILDLLEDTNTFNSPTPSNINARYQVGDVKFDNIDGLGATPNNQDVKYLGFAICITPDEFNRLAASGHREDTARELIPLMHHGKGIGTPFLELSFDNEEYLEHHKFTPSIIGHEGRARMLAVKQINGNNQVPVHVILRNGLRAKHLDEQFFADLRRNGILSEIASIPTRLNIGPIFWMNKTV